ncbi:MAG: tetratricopeptide repeat protein [Thermodesulfobacteriota bacterium]
MTTSFYDTTRALQKGFHLFNAGHHAEAVQVYHEVLAHHPHHPEAIHILGVIAFERCDIDTAVRLLEHAIAIHPQPPSDYFLNLAIARDQCGDIAAAIPLYRQAVALAPESAQAQSRLGHSLQQSGNVSEAMGCYLKAMELDPQNGEPFFFLGTILEEQKDHERAINCYRAALSRTIQSVKIAILLGNSLNRQGLFNEATRCYRYALSFMHPQKKASANRLESNVWLRLVCQKLRGKVLSVGSGNDFDKEASLYREYFGNCTSYTRLDMNPLLFPDLVGDVQQLSEIIDDAAYDVVFSVWALEHVRDIEAALSEIHRILVPGGFFVFGLPFNMEYHSYPCDFHRFTKEGIETMLAGKFHIAQLNPVGPQTPFTLDPRLLLHGKATETAPYSHVGIALKI